MVDLDIILVGNDYFNFTTDEQKLAYLSPFLNFNVNSYRDFIIYNLRLSIYNQLLLSIFKKNANLFYSINLLTNEILDDKKSYEIGFEFILRNIYYTRTNAWLNDHFSIHMDEFNKLVKKYNEDFISRYENLSNHSLFDKDYYRGIQVIVLDRMSEFMGNHIESQHSFGEKEEGQEEYTRIASRCATPTNEAGEIVSHAVTPMAYCTRERNVYAMEEEPIFLSPKN